MVRKAYSWEDCETFARQMLASGPVAAQENFIGEGVGVELLLKDGEPLLAFQHVRVHEPLHGGGSSYRKSVPVSPHLLEATLKILRPLRYTGVAMGEFKVNPQTGDWIFIEINGRFWGSLPLAVAAGADFPLALFQMLVEGRTQFPQAYRLNLHCRNWSLDLGWQRANLTADRSDPTLATRPLARVARDAVLNTLLLRERSDLFTRDDPMPGVAELGSIFAKGGRGVSGLVWRRYLQSPPARRALARRARQEFLRAKSVLFVCKGNICRSPFAENYACQCLPQEVTLLSSGYYPQEGRTTPENGVAAAAEWGVDLAPHRSRVLSEERIRAADILFVFDLENYRRLRQDYPFARPRIHFLGALAPDGPLFIADPWGQEETVFRTVYGQIAHALQSARRT
jgi:protein-tyrosine-phosphatase